MDTKQNTGSSCSCSPGPQAQSCGCSADSPPAGEIGTATSTITFANQLDHFLARWAWNRNGHRVEPGLYRLGSPIADSPVFASANYTLSFDALRSALTGIDAWILVLDTKGGQCLVRSRKRDVRDGRACPPDPVPRCSLHPC